MFKKRLVSTIGGAIGLLILIPIILTLLSSTLNNLFRPIFGSSVDILEYVNLPWNIIIGIVIIAVGLLFSILAFIALFRIGKGSAAPFAPTKQLVVTSIYKYSRNPMVFGVIMEYIGVGIMNQSWIIIIIPLLTLVLPYIVYIKMIEEKGLISRFGDDYLTYRQETSFLIPLPGKKVK